MQLDPLISSQRPRTGRPNHDHQTVVNGILWVLRTGAPWQDLPERYGEWTTIYGCFLRCKAACVWERILAQVQSAADERGEVDWEIHFVHGSIVRAHHQAVGQKSTPEAEALGRSQVG